MKNTHASLFVFILGLFFCGSNAVAQKLHVGPEIGTNLIMLQKTDLGRDYHLGWFAGGNVEYDLTDYFSIRSGVYFSHRKKYFDSYDTSGLTVLGFDLATLGIEGVDFNVYSKTRGVTSQFGIEVPLLASFTLKGFSIFAGPYMNFMVGAWTKEITDSRVPFLQLVDIDSIDPTGFLGYLLPPAESSTSSESSGTENLRVFDYGFKTGASFTQNNFRVNFYYVLGIPDYRIDRGTDDINAHHYYTLSLCYNFGVGKNQGRSSFGD